MKKLSFDKNAPLRIILFRTDRIGDTVLSLQCIEAIKNTYPKSYICFVVRRYTSPLLENNPFLDEVICEDNFTQKELVRFIKVKKFDISISLFASKRACFVPFLARIPVRIGPFSKIRSLLFTHKITQKRSLGEKNEAQYNLDLLKPIDVQQVFYPKIYLNESEKNSAKSYLKNTFQGNKKLIIIHPGSGGSSKDWELKNYFLLAEKVISENIANILITGSSEELKHYKNALASYPILNKSHLLDEEKPLRKLLAIISCANVFISNSTGPLHCAGALGIKTIGFYPLTQHCKPERWGVFTNCPHNHLHLTPNKHNYSEEIFKNKPFEECMETITIEDALNAVTTLT